jgi:hypothetical protein
MTTCYIVEGSCGRYEDEQSWVVMVFLHLVVAQHWCDRLNQWCTDHGLAVSPKDDVPYERWNPLPHNPLDPGRAVTLEDAQHFALKGCTFGELHEGLENEEQRRLFKAWWLYEPKVPVHRASPQEILVMREPIITHRVTNTYPTQPNRQQAREMGFTGDICPTCGSVNMIRNQACLLCLDCKTSTGCS